MVYLHCYSRQSLSTCTAFTSLWLCRCQSHVPRDTHVIKQVWYTCTALSDSHRECALFSHRYEVMLPSSYIWCALFSHRYCHVLCDMWSGDRAAGVYFHCFHGMCVYVNVIKLTLCGSVDCRAVVWRMLRSSCYFLTSLYLRAGN